MRYPLVELLARTAQPCLLITAETDVFARCVSAAREARPDARVAAVEDTDASRASVGHIGPSTRPGPRCPEA